MKKKVKNARSLFSSPHYRLFRFFRVVRPRVRPTVAGADNEAIDDFCGGFSSHSRDSRKSLRGGNENARRRRALPPISGTACFLPPDHSVRACAPAGQSRTWILKRRAQHMNLEHLVGGAVSVLLIGYLLYALLKPEKF
jgi:K+-transporting ATPase KdpF subunit